MVDAELIFNTNNNNTAAPNASDVSATLVNAMTYDSNFTLNVNTSTISAEGKALCQLQNVKQYNSEY